MAAKRKTSLARTPARAKTPKPAPPARRAVASKALASKARPASAKPAKRAKATSSAHTPIKRKKVARARGGSPTAMFQKVAFTMFSVEDAQRARRFYEDVLGLRRGLASPEGTWTEYDLPGGGCLALFRHPDPKFARSPGGASIALEVLDLDALNERLKQAGVVYQGDMVHGPHCRMSNILDSEGNTLILHQLDRG